MTTTSARERIYRLRNEWLMRGYPERDLRIVISPHIKAELLVELTREIPIYPVDDYRTAHGATVFGIPCEVDRSLRHDQIKLVLELEG